MSNNPYGNPYNTNPPPGYQPNMQGYPPQGGYPPPQMGQGMPYPPMQPMNYSGMPPSSMGNQMNSQIGQYEYRGYPQPSLRATPSQNPNQQNYSFLDSIIPTEKHESFASNILQPQTSKITEVYKKLYIGRIPMDVKDNLIERILKACGGVEYWKRAINAEGVAKSFGYCEFEDVEGAII